MSFVDKTLTCRDCGQTFVWTAGEQEFYQSRGFQHEPARCRNCRNARKAERAGGAAEAAPAPRGSGRGQREMYPAVCDECGKPTMVPFQPTSGKPLYCSECFERHRGPRY
ncbi:MAG TPA: zinc-ribbon domain containing protein [Chloroflexota bacterium]|nr:zinc-ribbon domain containing protein [Chloroflexota bacterium]